MARHISRQSAIEFPTWEQVENSRVHERQQKPATPELNNDPSRIKIINSVVTRITENGKPLAESLEDLPEHLKAPAILDMSEPFSMRIAPEGYRIVRITVPKEKSAEAEAILASAGASISTNHGSMSANNDTVAVFQELAPDSTNALYLYQLLTDAGIHCHVAFSTEPSNSLLIRLGNTVIATNPTLYHETLAPQPANTATPNGQLTMLLNETSAHRMNGPIDRKLGPDSIKKFGPDFYTGLRTIGSLRSQDEKDENKERQAIGSVNYLVINPHILLRNGGQGLPKFKIILDFIASIANSEDFLIKKDALDNIVIIALQERGAGFLQHQAMTLHEFTDNKAHLSGKTDTRVHLRFGTGTLSKDANNELQMDDYLSVEELLKWSHHGEREGSSFMITKEDYEKLKGTRETTTAKLVVEEIPGTNYLRITEVIRQASLRDGSGPDRLIGQQDILTKLRQLTGTTSKTRLTVVKGQAGIGKSRILDELRKTDPRILTLSIDPSCEKLPGMALINIIEQLATHIHGNIKDLSLYEKFKTHFGPLFAIYKTPPAERLNMAQTNPDSLRRIIAGAIGALEAIDGSFTIILDDLHHIDAHSDHHIMKALEDLVAHTKCNIIATMRPEDRFKSTHQKALENGLRATYTQKTVEEVWLEDPITHKPKLNLQDPEIARDYVFYSLPESTRVNSTTGEEKTLTNNWHLTIAENAITPWQLTSRLNIILRDPGKYLSIGDNEIALTNAAIEKLQSLSSQEDLIKHERSRIRKLPQAHRQALQLIAMIGTRIGTEDIVQLVIDSTSNKQHATTPQEAIEIIKFLAAQNYLSRILDKEGKTLALEMENVAISEMVVESIGKKAKKELVNKYYRRIASNPEIPGEIKLSWLQASADCSTLGQHRMIWEEYAKQGHLTLQSDRRGRQYSKGLSHASAILCHLDMEADTDIARLIKKLTENPLEEKPDESTSKMIQLIKHALLTYIESSANLGQFAKAHQAIEIFEKICAHTKPPSKPNEPESPNDLKNPGLIQSYRIGFRVASIEESHIRRMDKRIKMNAYYDKIRKNLGEMGELEPAFLPIHMQYEARRADQGPTENVVRDLETWLKRYDLKQPHIAALKTNHPELYARVKLLHERYLFECTTRKPLTRHNIDDDGVVEPSYFNPEETEILTTQLRQELDALRQEREQNPMILDPMDEIAFMELLGQTYAYCGEYERATQAHSEAWRLGNQLGLPRQAARIAKFKGDIQVMQATTRITYPTGSTPGSVEPLPAHATNRLKLLEAIDTLTEEAAAQIKRVDANDFYYTTLIPNARINAISLLLETYQGEIASIKAHKNPAAEKNRIKQEVLPFILMALKDFTNFNNEDNAEDPDGEFNYYVLPHMAFVWRIIEDLDFTAEELQNEEIPNFNDTENPNNFPVLTHQALVNAITRLDTNRRDIEGNPIHKLEDHAGKVGRKIRGFEILIDLIRKASTYKTIEEALNEQILTATNPMNRATNENIKAKILGKMPNHETLETILATIVADRSFPDQQTAR